MIEKNKQVFLIYPRKEITGVVVSSAKLGSLKVLLERFMKTIENFYTDKLQKWETHTKLFEPIENIAREIFLF